jgi:uncharacterized membrane protein
MRRVGFAILGLLSLGVAGYALVTYGTRPLGSAVHPEMRATYEAHRLPIYAHIFASMLALVIGPWQFVESFRVRAPRIHRICGRIYLLIGVGLGGATGFAMAWLAYGGAVSTSGFGLLSILWLDTGLRAYRSVRQRDFSAHRRWMIRNFSLTFAAVTLRLGLGIGFASRLPFEWFYPPLAWLSWVPNIAIAEILIRTRLDRQRDRGQS